MTISRFFVMMLFLSFFIACSESTNSSKTSTNAEASKKLQFKSLQVVDSANYWWALTHGDLNGDGLEDIVFIDGNANASGYLGYKVATSRDTIWEDVVIAKAPPLGGGFAAGDLEAADMDGDGDIDVLAVQHPGEWVDATAEANLYWYENPGKSKLVWEAHQIGQAKGAVKDMSIGDFNNDGLADLAVMTFDEENVRIHRHNADGTFTQVADLTRVGIHEGMDIGDLDGDGDLDIAANGYAFINPGDDLTSAWNIEEIHPRWFSQKMHKDMWSLNATKTFIADIDDDGQNEIFMSHSENAGYPLVYYTRTTSATWEENIILDSLPAAHTLMVFDMDLDGDKDIVTGVNPARAVNLNRGYKMDQEEGFPVYVLLNSGDHKNFEPQAVSAGGIYNGRVADYDGDGDFDIFRYPNHESRELYILVNNIRS